MGEIGHRSFRRGGKDKHNTAQDGCDRYEDRGEGAINGQVNTTRVTYTCTPRQGRRMARVQHTCFAFRRAIRLAGRGGTSFPGWADGDGGADPLAVRRYRGCSEM